MHFHLPKPVHGWREFASEVGIIVVGVLLALLAEQFVEWIHWRHQQHERLERLFDEARMDVTTLRDQRDLTAAMTKVEGEFATEISRGSCPGPKLWDAVATVNMYPAIVVPSSVYDEVVGAGGLSALESSDVRKAVSSFHAMLSWAQSQTEAFRTHASPAIAIDDPRVTVTFDPNADEPEVFAYDRSALCSDKAFRNRVADRVRDHESIYNLRRDLTMAAIRMCARLGKDLSDECVPTVGGPLRGSDLKAAREATESNPDAGQE